MSSKQHDNPRILFVAPSSGAIDGQAEQLLMKMRSEGWRVDLLPTNPQPPGILRHLARVKYLRELVILFFYIISLFQRIPHYDVIHIFSSPYFRFILAPTPAILVSRFYGKPSILNYRSAEAEDHFYHWGKIVFPLLYLLDAIVVPSLYLAEVFAEFGFAASAISDVIDEQAITFRLRESVQPKIIVARTLELQNNIPCSLLAYQMVKDKYPRAELTILGSGPDEARLKSLTLNSHLAGVTFIERLDRPEVDRLYQQSDVCLNSSSIDDLPVSILEAFAAGLPIVTTNAGGIPFVISDKINGYLVAVDDYVALAEKIIELIENPAEVRRLSEQGAIEIKKYRWSVVVTQWRELYRHTIAVHNTPAVTFSSEESHG